MAATGTAALEILIRAFEELRAPMDNAYDKLNAVMHNILKGRDVRWSFMEVDGNMASVAAYATGTVAFTNGSTGVVGDGTTFTAGMVGRKIIFAGSTVLYTIETFTDTTNIVLDRVYEGDTVMGASYLIYQDKYALASDFGEMLILRDLSNNVVLQSFDTTQFEEYAEIATATSTPARYALYGEDSSGYEQLLFYPAPGEVVSYGYRYYKEPTIMADEADALDTPPKYDHVVIALLKAQITGDAQHYALADSLLDNMISANVRDRRASVQKVPLGIVGRGVGRIDPNAVLTGP